MKFRYLILVCIFTIVSCSDDPNVDDPKPKQEGWIEINGIRFPLNGVRLTKPTDTWSSLSFGCIDGFNITLYSTPSEGLVEGKYVYGETLNPGTTNYPKIYIDNTLLCVPSYLTEVEHVLVEVIKKTSSTYEISFESVIIACQRYEISGYYIGLLDEPCTQEESFFKPGGPHYGKLWTIESKSSGGRYTFSYDKQGNLLGVLEPTSAVFRHYVFKYENNKLIFSSGYSSNDAFNTFRYFYDNEKLVKTIFEPTIYAPYQTISYYTHNNLDFIVQQSDSIYDGVNWSTQKKLYEYDASGNLTKETLLDSNDNLVSESIYEYNETINPFYGLYGQFSNGFEQTIITSPNNLRNANNVYDAQNYPIEVGNYIYKYYPFSF